MKIELKLNNDAIMLVAKEIEGFSKITTLDFASMTRENKSKASVCIEIADIFLKKKSQIQRTSNLFDSKKLHIIKLKYYQAENLLMLITSVLVMETNQFNLTVLAKVNNQLHQKLQD